MKAVIIAAVWALTISLYSSTLETMTAIWNIDEKSGALGEIRDKSGKTALSKIENRYYVMAVSGDRTAVESGDKVINVRSENGRIAFDCRNKEIPVLLLSKEYWVEGDSLRRKITFHNEGKEKIYITPVTELFFDPEFRQNSYVLGAGYIGPLIPFPQVDALTRVTRYYQTTKGMVLSNWDGKKSFSHYRLKLNDTMVFPWWQSTISTYQEKPNILHYTPNGWSMALGTLDLEPGGNFSVTDTMNLFDGTWFQFFDKIYGADPVVKKELDTIAPVPEWLKDVRLITPEKTEAGIRRLAEATDDGFIMVVVTRLIGDWADYRIEKNGANGFFGGHISGTELREHIRNIKAISPRIKVALYSWITSVNIHSPIFRERPEWFKRYDREGNEASLFPGSAPNFATMVNRPDCAEFMWKQLFDSAEFLGADYIYLDETKTTNFINWQTGELVRDDHWYEIWKNMKKYGTKALFFNGRGNPYGDINYIEAYAQLEAGRWREFAGMGLGVETFLKLRPDARISPLYWTPKVDYATRLLALGWIPTTKQLEHMDFVRAAYETGNADPVDAVYTPDWKKDSKTEIESYIMRRRNSSDVLMSFINRTGKTADIPVDIDLRTLGFDSSRQINIWGMKIDQDTVSRYVASDTEFREARRDQDWLGGLISAPELLYSGAPSQTLKHVISNLENNRLYQFVVTASPLAVYSLDDLGANYFYTSRKGLVIDGMTIRSEYDNAEIILADKDHIFTDIRVNGGTPTAIRQVDIGGVIFQVFKLGKGEFTVSWTPKPRIPTPLMKVNGALKEDRIEVDSDVLPALEFNGKTLYTGKSPIVLPKRRAGGKYILRQAGNKQEGVELDIPAGEKSHLYQITHIARHPQKKQITKVEHQYIRTSAMYLSPWTETMQLQNHLPPAIADADHEQQTLRVGQTRRIDNYQGAAFAGFELKGIKKIQIKLENSFYNAPTIELLRHVEKYRRSPQEFAGFVIDYRVGGRHYAKRVALSVGVLSQKASNPLPPWGKNTVPEQFIELGNLLDEGSRKIFSLDLTQWAPENWDGTVFFSLGTDHVKPDRRLAATILAVNNRAKAPILAGLDAEAIRKEFTEPKKLIVPRITKSPGSMRTLDASEWQSWGSINRFFLVGGCAFPKMPTQAWFSYDDDYLYVGVKCTETGRKPITGNPSLWDDDEIELWFDGKSVIQIMVNAAGQSLILKDGKPQNHPGVISKGNTCENQYFDIFIAVPFKLLDGRKESIRFNIGRLRQPGSGQPENSTWSGIMNRFREVENFGTLEFQ